MATINLQNITTRRGQAVDFDRGLSITLDRSGVITHRFGNGAIRQTIKGTRPTTYKLSGTISALTSAELTTLLANVATYGVMPNYITYNLHNTTRTFIVDGDIKTQHVDGDYYNADLTLIEVFV